MREEIGLNERRGMVVKCAYLEKKERRRRRRTWTCRG